MTSCRFPKEKGPFDSKREVVFEESADRAKVCDDGRQYLQNTMKEFRVPMTGATLPFATNYKNSLSKIQGYLSEVVNTPLFGIFRELEAKKAAWKQLVQDKYMAYRENHDGSVVRTHQALLDASVPAMARVEQALRHCAHFTDADDALAAISQTVGDRSVQAAWSERLSATRTEGYPAPRIFLPSKLSAGLELIKEGLSEMELTFEDVSHSKPFEAKDSDWFSYSHLEPLVHQYFCGSLASGVGSDGVVTVQLCEFDLENSLTRSEVLDLIVARLRYRLLLGDPTLRQLALSPALVADLRSGTHVAICRWNDAHPQMYRGRVESVDVEARRCQVCLIDFGPVDSFGFDEIFVDARCAKDLRSIPPLAFRCHIHAPSLKLQNPAEAEAAIRALEAGNKGRFTFHIVAEHCVDEEFAWEIFVSDSVSSEFQFPPSPPPPPPPPPPLPKLTIKTDAPEMRAPPRPKNIRQKNSPKAPPARRKGQPSPRTPPVVAKTELKTPPVPKAGPVDKQRAGPKTQSVFAKHGRSDNAKWKSGPKIHRIDKSKPESRTPPVPKAEPVDKPTEEPKTPPPPNVNPAKEKYVLNTPPVSNSGAVNKEKYAPSTPPLTNAGHVGKPMCEPRSAAPPAKAAPPQKASPRAPAPQRTPPGPRTLPVAKKVLRGTSMTWQKQLVQSIVQDNSKRKGRGPTRPPPTSQQCNDWSDWGDE